MNSPSSAKDLFRSACIALVLMLALVVVARGEETPVAPPPPAAPEPAPRAEEKNAPAIPNTAPAPIAAPTPTATLAPTPATEPAAAPPPAEEKSALRRLDNLPESAANAAPAPTPARSRSGSHFRTGNPRVAFGRDSFLGANETAEEVISVFGSSTSEGTVSDSVVSIMGDTRVSGPVGDAAIAVFGDVYVDSKVDRDVVAVMGNVELGPRAEVGGEVVVIGGTVTRDPAAIVHRGVQNVGFSAGHMTGFEGLRAWFRECFLYARPLAIGRHLAWVWVIALSCLALYTLIALLFRGAIERCVDTLEKRPGTSILAVLLSILLTPIALILLSITGVGLLVVPFICLGLFVATLFGRAVMLAWLGRRFGRTLPLPLSILIGGAMVLGLYLVPVVGFIVYAAIKMIGLGVVIYTVLLSIRSEKPAPVGRTGVAVARPLPPISMPPSAGFTASPSPSFRSDFPIAPVLPARAVESGTSSEPAPTETPLSGPPAEFTAPVPPTLRSDPMPPVFPAVSLPRAGFGIRTAGMLLDLILISIVLGPLTHTGGLILPGLAIYAAIMWKVKGTTVGGIICGLKVVRLDDRPIDWPTAIVRALGCFLSTAVAGLGFIWVAFDDQRQSWHDKIAGTVVVKMPRGTSLV